MITTHISQKSFAKILTHAFEFDSLLKPFSQTRSQSSLKPYLAKTFYTYTRKDFSFFQREHRTRFIYAKNQKIKTALNISIISSLSILIWYFLYYQNRAIIKDFIDFEIKHIISKLVSTNSAVVNSLANHFYKFCSRKSTQEQFIAFLKENLFKNEKALLSLRKRIKEEIIEQLSNENNQEIISNFIYNYLSAPATKSQITEIIINYLDNPDSVTFLQDKIIQLLNDQNFREYVFDSVAIEAQKSLRNKENVQYTVENLKSQMKI